MKPISYYIRHPQKVLAPVFMKTCGWMPDKPYLQLFFLLKMGKVLHLKRPKTYNEKLQWLKLYNHRPEYTKMVDKYAVKDYVAGIVGKEYVIPTLGVWDKPEDIDFDCLPDQFVLKTTHGGGNTGVIVCKDKSKLDRADAIRRLSKSMRQDLFKSQREWPYKNVKRRILAEAYMEDAQTKELRDYKFFAFDGEVKALFIATDRGSGDVKFDYYDADFNHLDLVQQHPMSGMDIQKPACFEEMKQIAGKLSVGMPHVRVDLYQANGKIYFGEYTFSHHGGCVPFHPEEWDYKFGSWIKLPEKS